MKRLFDISLAACLLFFLFPVLMGVSLVVLLKLGRPVLFKQQRPGLMGNAFLLYKFRTMSEERDDQGQLLKDGQRLSSLGRLLRKFSLDELPQLINVLKGEMSFVGPRPLLMEYLPLYSPEQGRRHLVKPGITGWAQVNGRNALSWEDKFNLDLWYVEQQSFWLDLKILWMTFIKVLRSEGISQKGHATMTEFKGGNHKTAMKDFNILFTSAGRRVALIRHFKETLQELGLSGKIITADLKKTAPASFVADIKVAVPRVESTDYIPTLMEICKQYQVNLLIPLIDPELHILAQHKADFQAIGTTLLVSSPEVTELCLDKSKTSAFFTNIGVKTPQLLVLEKVSEDPQAQYPFFLKPAQGSSSIGATKINNHTELLFFKDYIPNPILLEYISGEEYTLDVLVDFEGRVRSVVPRLRLETRAGEVSKGMTVKNQEIIAAGQKVAEALPGALGCITLQCFLTPQGELQFIEINPRFGGGFPLAIAAGADFPRWIIEMFLGHQLDLSLDAWEEGKVMLRYDDAIYVSEAQIHD